VSPSIFHLHDSYPEHCGNTDGIMTTNGSNVNCPSCLEAMSGLDNRRMLADNHATAMLKVLNLTKNVEKGGWSAIAISELLDLFDKEVEEFKAALWGYMGFHGTELQQVESEAADVSNFAAMIVDNCRRISHDNVP